MNLKNLIKTIIKEDIKYQKEKPIRFKFKDRIINGSYTGKEKEMNNEKLLVIRAGKKYYAIKKKDIITNPDEENWVAYEEKNKK